jgi:hypothetical protein
MRALISLTLVALAIALAACGDDKNLDSEVPTNPTTSSDGTAAAGAQRTCPDVKLTRTEQEAYATDVVAVGVSCATARKVAQQWGGQNANGPEAKLPTGWKCGSAGTCRKGGQRVSFSLAFR